MSGTSTSAKAYRINVKRPVYALVSTDTSSGCTYDTVKSLCEAMTITCSPVIATGTLYGDGVKQDESNKLTGMDVQLDGTKIAIEDRAAMLGHTYTNGILVEKDSDQAKYIAFGYEVEETGGKTEYVWLLKGKAQPMADTVKQSEGNITYSTDSVKLSFIPRKFDGAIRAKADTANPDFTSTAAATFMATVPTTFVSGS